MFPNCLGWTLAPPQRGIRPFAPREKDRLPTVPAVETTRGSVNPTLLLPKGDVGVSKNRGTPKWMVYMENPIKMDDLGGTIIFGNTHVCMA